ncbi:hypothetical protein MCOR07_007603 [Pyricularia oryzae]|nr:hypothetical protein MCOR26_007583 [Pyricularia oryzae]KAI6391238.1 hypothetical protein MCOR23_009094 [Pyricularia oryzae]KAI6410688.1 hypothetical protein MCOR24_007105 [Pyricularia oryzae]KAI6430084.1 hypothetical protein MCOR21_004766 [Pyricularia oryzae]KAI6440186.1 hypothetical protein MCOR22_007409 [Pyricularia oryzae]
MVPDQSSRAGKQGMFKTTLQENPHLNEQKTNILNRCSIPSSALSIMRYSLGTLLLALSQGIYADCGWRLNGNDCICMNSANGNAWTEWTSYCCQAMGRRTGGFGPVCTVTKDLRQTFKDCCKY